MAQQMNRSKKPEPEKTEKKPAERVQKPAVSTADTSSKKPQDQKGSV